MKAKLSIKEQARLTQMSERNVYKLRTVTLVRPDLADAYSRGELSIHKAFMLATARAEPTTRDRLWAAWHAASMEEQAEMIAFVMDIIEAGENEA